NLLVFDDFVIAENGRVIEFLNISTPSKPNIIGISTDVEHRTSAYTNYGNIILFSLRQNSLFKQYARIRFLSFIKLSSKFERESKKFLTSSYACNSFSKFLSLTATTQRITRQLVEEIKTTNQKKEVKKSPQLITFSFSLLTEKDAEVLGRKYTKFLKEIQEDLKELKSKTDKEPSNYLMFSGLLPIIRND
ncbi:unnamed protein product, partial [marine sediment metagenome]